MSAHIIPVKTAIMIFIVLVYMIFIPWLILHYRKYRYFSLWHTIVTFSFIFYSIAALFLVLLPLPQTRDTCSLQSPDTVHYVLRPFNFLDGLKELNINWSNPRSYLGLIREQAFLEPFFNAILLFPLGVYVRYFFQQRKFWWKAVLITFSVSLFFEITQVTGIYGIYNCPYRLFDVDDLFFNTLGGFFGYFLAPILLALFPSKDDVREKSEKYANRVTPMTQLLAVILDVIIVQLVARFALVFTQEAFEVNVIVHAITYMIVFIFIPLIWNGRTLGSAFLRFTYRDVSGAKAKWYHYTKRFIAICAVPFVMAITRYITALQLEMDSPFYTYEVFIQVVFLLLMMLMWFVLSIHALYVMMKRGKRPFYFDKASKVKASRMDREV